MKFCQALYGSLNIERDRVHFCCSAKQHMPAVPWDLNEPLPLENLKIVRDALIRDLNGDMNNPVPEYVTYGVPETENKHPCKGCRHIIEVSAADIPPSSGQLTHYLHMQAFTFCNAKCIYCNLSHDEGNTPLNRGKELDEAIYRSIRQLFEANAISPSCEFWFSSGEPALSSECMKTLSFVVQNGFKVLINTNAICYAPEIEDALKSGNAKVQISLDSGDRESYRAVKGVDKFDIVVQNIDRYAAAAKSRLDFWLKYIVFSETNSKNKIDKFIEFCVQHTIRNVSVSTNLLEGEKGRDAIYSLSDNETLNSYAYLATQLELKGIGVHKQFAHLTINEQDIAKNEYAREVLTSLGFTPDSVEKNMADVRDGLELNMLPSDDLRLKNHIFKVLRKISVVSKGLALFSAGEHSRWIYEIMLELSLKPVAVFDNNPPETSLFDCPVVKPSEISAYEVDTVIVASNAYHLQIYSQLISNADFNKVRIFDPYLNLPTTVDPRMMRSQGDC